MEIKKYFLPLVLLFSCSSNAELDTPDVIAEGGRLYDKWWAEYEIKKPRITHTSYPASGKKSGASTWRCKECHGWDYRGSNGAYSKGSHYTGIIGITGAKGKTTNQIVSILKNNIHQYDTVMLDYGLIRIANFVQKGQLDISTYVNAETRRVTGNIKRGKEIYNESCKDCHGGDGRERNFKTRDKPEYIGTVSLKNPWEAIHKIRYGHPGAFVRGDPMPHMYGVISLKEQIDLLAYMQSLPIK